MRPDRHGDITGCGRMLRPAGHRRFPPRRCAPPENNAPTAPRSPWRHHGLRAHAAARRTSSIPTAPRSLMRPTGLWAHASTDRESSTPAAHAAPASWKVGWVGMPRPMGQLSGKLGLEHQRGSMPALWRGTAHPRRVDPPNHAARGTP